ncbi:heterokaryon incompatibility protein or allele [Diplodia corticola]|uniref:Heterokaryon incompatibility protein or allele n=1 Tax=Diplodia corticola TaxID=236234 RepID=A0A1J9RQ25_9PEZI|nr:heterokaryon incompatibility protein or allele [Diplodia corticola]OJD34667.1 heterokaryon incompatibility protein or allele [Diplodia corticola]
MSSPFSYPPLDQLLRQIRLIRLHPASPEDPIECSIYVASLNNNPEYEALSYAWGEAGGGVEIQLNGKPFTISICLSSALRHIRNEAETRVLWVDALCINQQDYGEKEHQVKIMGMVYRKCKIGLLWIGEESERSDAWCPARSQRHCDYCIKAPGADGVCSYDTHQHHQTHRETSRRLSFSSAPHGQTKCKHLNCRWHGRRPSISAAQQLMKSLEKHHLHEIPALKHALQPREKLEFEIMEPLVALGALMSRSWWTRMWTVQEAALPPISTLCYGKLTLPLVEMARSAEELFYHSQNCCSEFFAQLVQRLDKLSCGEATVNALFNFQKHVHTLDLTRRWIEQRGTGINLMDCLYNFHDRKSKHPRDKIFACLGLHPSNFGLDADYKADEQKLYQSVSLHLLRLYPDRSLSILWRETEPAEPADPDHPSWVKEFDKETTAMNRRARSVHYNASKDGSIRLRHYDKGILSFVGTKADAISDVTEHLHFVSTYSGCQFSTFRKWAKFLKLHERQSVAWLGDFTKTLSGDVHRLRPDYSGLDEKKLESFVKSLLKKRPRYDLVETSLAQELNTSAAGRKLFKTQNGRIGLGPEWMQPGDEIWVLSGGSVPFILRPLTTDILENHEAAQDGAEQYHIVVGDCYVQGIMFGEAVSNESHSERVFLT